jgi:hypothetical protein
MSRYNEYTRWFICMNRNEQAGWTRAFVHLARKPELTASECITLSYFEKAWLSGKDFTADRTYDLFIQACRRHGVLIRFRKKPARLGREGERGKMEWVQWTQPEQDGSYWPAWKVHGRKRTTDEVVKLKIEFRRKVMLTEMMRLGIDRLNFTRTETEEQIRSVVREEIAQIKREYEQQPAEPVQIKKLDTDETVH